MRCLAFFVTLFMAVGVLGQLPNTSATSFTSYDLANFCIETKTNISVEVYELIKTSKLKTYKDQALKEPLSLQEFEAFARYKEYIQVLKNPSNPNEYKDTFVYIPFRANGIVGFAFADDKAVAYLLGNGHKVYFSYSVLMLYLSVRSKAQFLFYKSAGLTHITYDSLPKFCDNVFKRWGSTWYNYGEQGLLKAYKNPSFTEFFSKDDFVSGELFKRVFQIQNPENPDDIYDLIDTTVITPFTADSVKRLRLYYQWNYDGYFVSSNLLGIAPMFQPTINGKQQSYIPVFLLKEGDFIFMLSGPESAFLQPFFQWILQTYSSDRHYRHFYFQEDHTGN
jgi:hypothetical protein